MAEGNGTKHSSKDRVGSAVPLGLNDTPDADVAGLIEQAKQAIEQKQLKRCTELINEILNIDPYNKEVSQLRSSLRSHLKQDLSKVRLYLSSSSQTYAESLVQKARSGRQRRLYSRAEKQLHEILNIDPEHEEARNLLSLVSSLQSASQQPLVPKSLGPAAGGPAAITRRARIGIVFGVLALIGAGAGLWFGISPSTGNSPADSSKLTSANPVPPPAANDVANSGKGTLALLVFPIVGAQLSVNDGAAVNVPDSLKLDPGSYQLHFSAAGYSPETVTENVVAGEEHRVVVTLKPVPEAATPLKPVEPARPVSVAAEPGDRTAAAPKPLAPPEPVPVVTGSLQLSARIPVDVYLLDKYLGSIPIKLQLPSGSHTLEFRYRDLRKTASFVIRADETTLGTISFDVPVQINAKPWAEVFIEGVEPRRLGETPLSGVNVPIGSVLLFKNPSFGEKRYRVIGKETSIQVSFP